MQEIEKQSGDTIPVVRGDLVPTGKMATRRMQRRQPSTAPINSAF